MDSCGCADPFQIFDQKTADEDLARYRQDGPDRTTRMLLDMIRSVGLRGVLVRMSASRARALYGLVLPRDRTIVRLGLRLLNVWFRIRGIGYRSYAHSNRVVDALVADAGLRPRMEDRTFAWRVVLYDRPGMPA
jgi:hypothetical protein